MHEHDMLSLYTLLLLIHHSQIFKNKLTFRNVHHIELFKYKIQIQSNTQREREENADYTLARKKL